MSRHRRASRYASRIWMTANTIVLVAIAVWILRPSATGTREPDVAPPSSGPLGATEQVNALPTKDSVLALPGKRFGLSTPGAPWRHAPVDRVAKAAGSHPTVLQYFVKWTEEFRPEGVRRSYQQGALPVISWEPWTGAAGGTSQPAYRLSKIIDGAFDPYLTRFASAVRDQRWPVGIRFAHEMNGLWYPWSERRSGNQPGEYARAWQHVHDVFTKVGATNVIWIWSPNILRPVPNVSLRALYPGDSYVDWIGLVGYAVREERAAPVFEPTLRAVAQFTHRPVLITEAGARPSPHKAAWIADFFRWLSTQPTVIGFIWFEHSVAQGGNADWRFGATPQTVAAFRTGMATIAQAPPPYSGAS